MSLTKNIVFVHVPKAGGTSVRQFIMSQVSRRDIYPQEQLHHFPRFEHLDVDRPMLFMSHLGYDFVRDAKADALILMRHPIDRILSLYSYAMHPAGNVPIIGPQWVEGMSFEEFFTTDVGPVKMSLDHAQIWQIASGYAERHRALRKMRGVDNTHIAAEAKRNLSQAAVVGTLEDITGFYRDIAAYFGNPDTPLPQRAANVSEKRIKWVDLSPAQKTIVEACVADEWSVYDHARALAARG